jgi:hypothetical protein
MSMLARCRTPSSTSYGTHGARGIEVCGRWLRFENFLADMGEAPVGLTLDRIDNDGNYEPGNCRWATWKQQIANRRPFSNGKARLTDQIVREIRSLFDQGWRQADIAAAYGVSQSAVSQVGLHKTWKHVPEAFVNYHD